jgi:hypothetical protein
MSANVGTYLLGTNMKPSHMAAHARFYKHTSPELTEIKSKTRLHNLKQWVGADAFELLTKDMTDLQFVISMDRLSGFYTKGEPASKALAEVFSEGAEDFYHVSVIETIKKRIGATTEASQELPSNVVQLFSSR